MAIKYYRERTEISARKLSLECGLSPSYVSKLEKGELEPSLKAFSRIAAALRMTTPEVMFLVGLAATRDESA